MAGCATAPAEDPKDDVQTWPCASIARLNDGAVMSARYAYDDLHNLVWEQRTSLEGSHAGTILSTETKTFEGKIAVTEEYVGQESHTKTERKVLDGRIMTETFIDDDESPRTANWTYADGRVIRIDRQDATGAPDGDSEFTYPDTNTRIERQCTLYGDTEICPTVTLIGGVETYTTLREVSGDGTSTYEETRTLDANDLPTHIERAYLRPDGTRDVFLRIEIERRPDGAPLFMSDGRIDTTYQFSCD